MDNGGKVKDANPSTERRVMNMDDNHSELQIRLFGPMEVVIGGKPMPSLRSRKGHWLLALLVLNAGREVDRSRLAGLLWPETDETAALGNLRRTLTDLRQALGAESARIESPTSRTLKIDLDGAYADVLEFDSGIRNGDIASLHSAVGLYRGELLSGCAEEWVTQERSPREEEALAAFEALAEDALEKDNPHEAVRLIRRAAAINPWRENLQRCLLRALSADGDHAGLIVAFREFREALQRDLNARPDPETMALFSKLRSEARVHAVASVPPIVEHPASRPAARNVHLPHAVTPLVGRAQETQDVRKALSRSRLVTLAGAGGVGKTRLAVNVAATLENEFPDGIWFIALGSINEPSLVAKTVSSTMGIEERGGKAPVEGIKERVGSGDILLVLDNCEHLQDASGELAMELLEACGGLRILATSRHALGVGGEVTWRVPPLALPTDDSELSLAEMQTCEAVSLFEARAAACEPRFELNAANSAAVCAICRRLDGIPLAIELAAARVKVLPVDEIAARLDESLRILAGGSRSSLPHQQTLKATMDWSYRLLSPEERTLLARISVFAGGCTLQSAHRVCAEEDQDEWAILDLLSQLADKSLVVVDESRTGEARYRLLETVRQYGMERLQETDDMDTLRTRHLEHFLELARNAGPQMMGPDQAAWGMRLESDYDNFRLALEWAVDPELRLELGSNLIRFWQRRGFLAEGRAWLEGALQRQAADVVSPLRGLAFNCLGAIAMEQGDQESARRFCEEGLEVRRKVGAPGPIAASLNNLANAVIRQGDDAMARMYYVEALELMTPDTPRANRAIVLNNFGIVLARLGKLDEAEKVYEEALAIDRQAGNREEEAGCLNNIARLALVRGDFELGARTAEEALSINREVSNKLWDPQILTTLAHSALCRGDLKQARSYAADSLQTAESLGIRVTTEDTIDILAAVAMAENDAELAAWLTGAAESCREHYGDDHLLPVRHPAEIKQQLATALGPCWESVYKQGREAHQDIAIKRAIAVALSSGTPAHAAA